MLSILGLELRVIIYRLKNYWRMWANFVDDLSATLTLIPAQNVARIRPSLSTSQDRTCIQKARLRRTRILNTWLEKTESRNQGS
jgi:hypothetical protein